MRSYPDTMRAFILLLALFVVVGAQGAPQSEYKPQPYSYNYVATGDEGGESSHQEEGDGQGNVRGTYGLVDIDGRKRVVEYQAGPEGFRATVRTNEPGTDNQNPADVVMESTGENVGMYQGETRVDRGQPIPIRRRT